MCVVVNLASVSEGVAFVVSAANVVKVAQRPISAVWIMTVTRAAALVVLHHLRAAVKISPESKALAIMSLGMYEEV